MTDHLQKRPGIACTYLLSIILHPPLVKDHLFLRPQWHGFEGGLSKRDYCTGRTTVQSTAYPVQSQVYIVTIMIALRALFVTSSLEMPFDPTTVVQHSPPLSTPGPQ